MLKEQNRLVNEYNFSKKYIPLNEAKEFWLGGKTKQELRELCLNYLNEYYDAYGKIPSWMTSSLTILLKMNSDYNKRHLTIQDIENFKIIMRTYWKKSQLNYDKI